MAVISRVNLRKALSESIRDYRVLTATADGDDQKTSHVAAGLANFPGGADDGAFEEWYDFATSGANNGESRRVLSYIKDKTTLLYQQAHTAQTANGDTFELHRYDPALKHVALSIALAELFPWLYLPIRDESLMVDNLLSNSDFETYSAGFTGWTEVNSPTVSQETTRVYHLASSAKLVAPAGSVGQLTQAPSVNITEAAGKTVTFKMRVWTDAANYARLRLDWDGTTITNGTYHTGDSAWHLLSVTGTIPTTATQVKVICEVAATRTAYFDAGWLAIDPVYRYTVPSSIIRGPFTVMQQDDEDFVNGSYDRFPKGSSPTEGRLLRLTGMGVLSLPAADTGTVELGEPQVRLVIAYAKKVLWEQLVADSASQNRKLLLENVALAEREVARISRQPGIRMLSMAAQSGENAWHVEQSADARYLVFDVNRG